MKVRSCLLFTLIVVLSLALTVPYLAGQSLTQGGVGGTITDPSGAVIPGAKVELKDLATGATQTRTTNGTGAYNFALVPPGSYSLTFSAPNYVTNTQTVQIAVGQVTTQDVKLGVEAANQTVTVTAEGGVLQTTTPSVTTTMSNEQIQYAPNGGGDLSYIAQTAPGTVMNTQTGGGGLGNFSSNGVPANANNFTYNSMPENDPFLSLNNSGATNILLGQNDINETSVVSNGYSGEYSMPGANVNYVSKSGTNGFHGNASWRWNGTYVNANNYFNNQNSPPTPRPFVNDNMWQASFGGPIKKDKTFFFVDTEGLYLLIPVTNSVNVPTQAFESATLGNIAAVQPTALPLYQSMFNIYNHAPNSNTATNSLANGGCADFTGTLGFGSGNPCALHYNSTVTGNTHEWLVTGRLDQNFGPNDRAFIHFRTDHGVQATYTDPLTPAFNVTSNQPQYEGQLQWVHNFGVNTTNSFNATGQWYSSIFQNVDQAAALALQPVQINFAGNTLYTLGHGYQLPFATPQGRDVTEWGFVDDVNHIRGNHSIKAGVNFARYDISTHGPGQGTLPLAGNESLTDFFNGIGTTYTQSFPARLEQPINLYDLGFYGQDTWRVKSNLSLTFAVRADRYSNPSCTTNCFSRFNNNFQDIAHDVNIPYNLSIASGQNLALPDYHPWTVQPRVGFNLSPFGTGANLVISGGFGLFAAILPAAFVDGFPGLINNLPNDPSFTIPGLPFDPATPGNAGAAAAAGATAFTTGFNKGANFNALNAAVAAASGAPFSVPNFFNAANGIHPPRFQEWNLQVEKGFGNNTALTLRYAGNHGIWETVNNAGLNAYCGPTAAVTAPTGTPGCFSALGVSSFAGLPTAPMDPRFLTVTEISSGYTSNYNGLTASFLRRFSSFQFQFNYTWSHALDFASNSGIATTPFNLATNISITGPQNPFDVRQNMYGNADYDVRHYFSANYVYTTPKSLLGNRWGRWLGDWTIGGTIFARSGLPFTVVDTGTGGTLAGYGYGGTTLAGLGAVFAAQTGSLGGANSCGSQFASPVNGTCPVLTSNFASNPAGFGNQQRNQVRGPNFFDTDLSIFKNFKVTERFQLTVGATAYNLFNHPNFDQPVGDVASSQFGSIVTTVNAPTSIYGSGLGADASPRTLQSQIKLSF
jgi:Carboxypeptidase regulatory-like domain